MSADLYVQYGCGWDAPAGWLNFDASYTLRVERVPLMGKWLSRWLKGNPELFPPGVRYGDVVRGLPLADGACVGVYCSHVLEHLSLEECRAALRETRRLLRPQGVFRLVLPDLAQMVSAYREDSDAQAAVRFMDACGMAERVVPRSAVRRVLLAFSRARHRWLWDYPALQAELEAAGFGEVRRARLGDSVDPAFAAVERAERWEGCLGVECQRA